MAQRGWGKAASGSDLLKGQADMLGSLIAGLDLGAVERAAELLDSACLQKSTVFCVGNGGSAATASHIAADLSWGRRTDDGLRPRVISLASNTPLLTALANDAGYDNVFLEQLKVLFQPGDVVIAISASGHSENVLKAARFANEHEGKSVGLVGFDGGKLKNLCDISVHVPTTQGEYELVEDVHHAVCHMMANDLKFKAAGRSAGTV
jgi:D-sedoheptulose 7-phosphate isomerase